MKELLCSISTNPFWKRSTLSYAKSLGSGTQAHFGTLGREVQKPATFRHGLLNFIAAELPHWRDRQGVRKNRLRLS